MQIIVVAQLMKQYNIPISKVRTHQSWSGKYCPHRMLDEGRWNSFIERVQNAYNGSNNPVMQNLLHLQLMVQMLLILMAIM